MSDDFETGHPGATTSIPPYIPFQTFLTFLKQLKVDGLPPQIDKSVLAKFSGGTQGQLKVALKSMGLMDDSKPTDDLEMLVNAYDSPEFAPQLKRLLERTYPYVFAIDLLTATPTMFADAFKVTGAKEDVSRKCRSFFLHAAKSAGVSIGNRILTGSVPRATSNGSPKKQKKSTVKDTNSARQDPPPPPPLNNTNITEKALEYRLVDLMGEASSDPETMQAIIKVVTFLKTREAMKSKKAASQGDGS